MSGFGFSEAQELLRKEVRRFAEKEVAPGALQRSRLAPHDEYNELIKLRVKTGEQGWLSLNMPAKYGGQPIDHVSVGVIAEELARADYGLGSWAHVNEMASMVMGPASDEIKDRWIPPMIGGRSMACFGFTEPGGGSDLAALKAKAVREGDHYVLNGEKCPISHGMHADFCILAARTDPRAGSRGISMFFVPMDTPGVTRTPVRWIGTRHDEPGTINFDNARIPASYRLGEEGTGFYAAMKSLDWDRAISSLTALSAAQTCLEEAMAWTKQRVAFGQPIIKFEGVSFKIAEHYTLIEATKLLCYRALWLRDQFLPCTKETAMVKWHGPWEAVQAIHDALLIMGHAGYSEDSLIQKRLRDVMGIEIGAGTGNIQKLIIIRELMGREALPY